MQEEIGSRLAALYLRSAKKTRVKTFEKPCQTKPSANVLRCSVGRYAPRSWKMFQYRTNSLDWSEFTLKSGKEPAVEVGGKIVRRDKTEACVCTFEPSGHRSA